MRPLAIVIAVLSLGGCTVAQPNLYQQVAVQQDTVCLRYGPRMSTGYMRCLEKLQDEAEPHLQAAQQAGRDEAQRETSRALIQLGTTMMTMPPPTPAWERYPAPSPAFDMPTLPACDAGAGVTAPCTALPR
jgi:hypothetical protein